MPGNRFQVSIVPVGMVFYVLLYWLRSLVVQKRYPSKLSHLLQLARPVRGTALIVAGSILAGTSTHELLDSFTHQTGWLTQNMPLLQVRLGSFAGHEVKAYGVLCVDGCSWKV